MTLDDLQEEQRVLTMKLAWLEQKKLALLDGEGEIRTQLQRVENQISRLKKVQEKTPQ